MTNDVGLELPRDTNDQLLDALFDHIGDETWSEFDWLSLKPDDSLKSSWDAFCEIVKHRRRFFFHDIGEEDGNPDDRSPAQFFSELGSHIDDCGLIVEEGAGYRLFRARPRSGQVLHTSAAELGPAPPDAATQSNRMNPPGIPMFYGANDAALAMAETQSASVSIGTFETRRTVRLLDLATLPKIPGFFSSADRMQIFALTFLSRFADLIIQPVPRNDRVQIDYVPTQVFTEFLRDYAFDGGHIDGIRYRSATGAAGANVVLFATTEDVFDGGGQAAQADDRWLELVSVEHRPAP